MYQPPGGLCGTQLHGTSGNIYIYLEPESNHLLLDHQLPNISSNFLSKQRSCPHCRYIICIYIYHDTRINGLHQDSLAFTHHTTGCSAGWMDCTSIRPHDRLVGQGVDELKESVLACADDAIADGVSKWNMNLVCLGISTGNHWDGETPQNHRG